MKVAILFDNFGPYHLARLWAASQVMEVLGVEFAGCSSEYVWERSKAARSLQTVTLFPETSSRQVATKDFQARLCKVLDAFRPEAVAIPGWSGRGAFLALAWCLQNGVPAIVMSESTAHDEKRSGGREWVKRHYVGLCSAALVGGRLHEEYLVRLGMNPANISQGYDAVDNEHFAAEAAKMRNANGVRRHCPAPFLHRGKCRVRNEQHLPERFFLASARFVEKKNLSRLIEAYARYRAQSAIALEEKCDKAISSDSVRNPHSAIWSLVLLGDGELRGTLEAQVASLHLHDHVHLPGFVQYPELPVYYGLARAFVHASTTEPWGLVVNEAMASGLPVLVSNRCGCAADLVQEGVNGFTFDPENVDQLADLMLRLSTFDLRLSTFGLASREIISHWGPERFASGLLEAAKKALAAPRRQNGWATRILLHLLAHRY